MLGRGLHGTLLWFWLIFYCFSVGLSDVSTSSFYVFDSCEVFHRFPKIVFCIGWNSKSLLSCPLSSGSRLRSWNLSLPKAGKSLQLRKEMRYQNFSFQGDWFQDCWVASVLQYEIVKTAGLIHGTTLSWEREREWVLSVFPWHVSSRSQAFAKPLRTLPYWLWNIWNAGVRTGPLVACWSKMYKKGPLRQEVDQQRGVPEPWTKYKWNRGGESHFFKKIVWSLDTFYLSCWPNMDSLSVVGRTMPLVQMRHCPSSSWSSSVPWPRSCLHDASPVEWIWVCCFPSKKK